MTFLCLIGGCNWTAETHKHMGNETVLCQCCSRCGAHRYQFDDMSNRTIASLGNEG
jgi:hypothetical protein